MTRSLDDQFDVFSRHTFRHTFARRCFENGVDAKVVQSYFGHESIKMTMDLSWIYGAKWHNFTTPFCREFM